MVFFVRPSVIDGVINAPGSKPYTHRALFISALTDGTSIIENPNISDDVMETIDVLRSLKATVDIDDDKKKITVKGKINIDDDLEVKCTYSGTTFRFVTSIATLRSGITSIKISDDLAIRPIDPLLDAINKNSVKIDIKKDRVNIKGPINAEDIEIDGSLSSQFVSGLLIALPLIGNGTSLNVVNNVVSYPYITATIQFMKNAGITVKNNNTKYYVNNADGYKPAKYVIPGDITAIIPVIAGAFMTHGAVSINNITDGFMQPDLKTIQYLEEAGMDIKIENNSLSVGNINSSIISREVDVADIPDSFPILSILFSMSDGIAVLKGIARLKFKESDRVNETCKILEEIKAGYLIDEYLDMMKIYRINNLKTFKKFKNFITEDHRIFMAAVIAALSGTEESVINGSSKKSYPDFIKDLKHLKADITEEPPPAQSD